jgi:hypothetical protein
LILKPDGVFARRRLFEAELLATLEKHHQKKQIQALAVHPDDAALQLLSTTQDQSKREQGAANNEFRRSIIIIL